MHLFVAFVVIVVLIGLGFGRAMAKVLLVTVGIPAAIILLIIIIFNGPWAKAWGTPSPPAQVSYASPELRALGVIALCDTPDDERCKPQPAQAAPATPVHDLRKLGLIPICDTPDDERCKSQPVQAPPPLSDPYQKSLQALTGENLTPLN